MEENGSEGIARIGPDDFPLHTSSILKEEHAVISDILDQKIRRSGKRWLSVNDRQNMAQEIYALTNDGNKDNEIAAWLERSLAHNIYHAKSEDVSINNFFIWNTDLFLYNNYIYDLSQQNKTHPENRKNIVELCNRSRKFTNINFIVRTLATNYERVPPSSEEVILLKKLTVNVRNCLDSSKNPKYYYSLMSLLPHSMHLVLNEIDTWAETALDDIVSLSDRKKECWYKLLLHCSNSEGSRPSDQWQETASALLKAIGEAEFKDLVDGWLPLVHTPRAIDSEAQDRSILDSGNSSILKGIVWMLTRLDVLSFLRPMRDLAISCYKKIPGVGQRCVKVGNAAILYFEKAASVEAVGQLAILKVKVKFKTAQKLIEKALVATAHKAGVPRDELEEMAVPEYGLTEVGKRIEQFGDYSCEQVIENGKVDLRWFKPDGKQQKSIPAFVKENHADDLKELKDAGKDIAKLLPAQSARIEGSYLTEKVWDYDTWVERYLNHPLVATVARRLIWQVDGKSAMPADGVLRDADGKEVKAKKKSKVKLWHPLFVDDAEVQAWRGCLFDNQIKQPFKQAYREIYRLTDAEVNTGNYSNRFAAHIIKQHQFNALVATRGWSHTLRMMVDDEYKPAYIDLPHWNMRAEYWVEGVGDEYGQDTTEAGAYLRLVTDQVRFYRMGSVFNWAHAGGGGYTLHGEEAAINEPLSLSEIPELLFSEIFRDVDLFVGVASVGADPQWADGGAEGRFIDYWQNYSFGDLSETAKTRRELLERLIPMLKIADKCELSDKWLKVTGSIRTYKIHLGSGNILMEPNDEYLCIVANASMGKAANNVFLPFEGDRTMAVILSKAFLLADDKKIKDKTILSQIKRGQ